MQKRGGPGVMRRVPCLLALATLGLLSQLYSTLPEASPPPATAPAATGAYVCDLLAFGAKGDGHTDNTEAFRRALRSCGGLRKERRLLLEIPEGSFLTGSVNLTSHMTLRLLKGSRLLGVTEFDAYPLVPPLPSYGINRDWAKDLNLRPAALLSGFNLSDVIIEGAKGESFIDGQGKWWWLQFQQGPLPFGRPSLIQFMYSHNSVVRNLVLQNPAFWNTHFYASKHILVDSVRIEAPYKSKNTDGINLDSVQDAVVRRCVIATGDDAIAVKSGLNQAGLRFASPSAHIHLHDLEIHSKCLSIGSEMSGGIHDVLVENVRFGDNRSQNRWHGIYIKASRARGGVVRDLTFRNISSVARQSHQTKALVEISMSYGAWNGPEGRAAGVPPQFRNFSFRDLSSQGALVVANITGLVDSPVTDVVFEGIAASNHQRGILCQHTENVRVRGIKAHNCYPRAVQRLEHLDPVPSSGWRKARELLIGAVFGARSLPTRHQPERRTTGRVQELTWDLSGSFQINSTVFHAPLAHSKTAVLWHQGHHDCLCATSNSSRWFSKSPGFEQARCQPGCVGLKHVKDARMRRESSWWDLDNVTTFLHSLGHHVFILSMPLVGVNYDPRRSTKLTDHWWFQEQEEKGDATLRYFCEPVVLTMNYAMQQGIQEVYLAGLSGGAWTVSMVAAMDPRVKIAVQVAGAMPYSMRFSASLQPTGDIGDYEQLCNLPPHPFRQGARHIGYGFRRDAGREYCKVCNYRCQFFLASVEGRQLLQIFHEDDTCCYAAAQRHTALRSYETDIRQQLLREEGHGWFTVAVTDHRKHELSSKDKALMASVLRKAPSPGSLDWNALPCDVLHGESNLAAMCQESGQKSAHMAIEITESSR